MLEHHKRVHCFLACLLSCSCKARSAISESNSSSETSWVVSALLFLQQSVRSSPVEPSMEVWGW